MSKKNKLEILANNIEVFIRDIIDLSLAIIVVKKKV